MRDFETWHKEQRDIEYTVLFARSAYLAGVAEGRRRQQSDDRKQENATAIEAMWKERQGEDYGSY
jgi:hypothetical protein